MNNVRIINYLKFIITIALLYWISTQYEISKTLDILVKLKIQNVIVLIFICVITTIISSVKLRFLLKNVSLLIIFKSSLLGYFAGAFFFGQATQEFAKGIYLIKIGKQSFEQTIASLLFDKATSICGLLIVGSLGFIFSNFYNNDYLIIPILILILILFIIKIFKKYFNKIKFYISKNYKTANKISNYIIFYTKNKRVTIINIVLGILFQLISTLFYYLCAMYLDININYWNWCWMNAVMTLVLFIPLSLMGVGIREVSLIYLMGMMGCEPESAITFSIVIYCIISLYSLFCAVTYFIIGFLQRYQS